MRCATKRSMSLPTDRPLVTFALITFNQVRLVKEAVTAALAQDYSPLQIVICDDHSSDGTFDAIQEVMRGYAGPHRVVLHRNERNLGVAGNVNQAFQLAEGELVLMAAGDDVSLPHRTSRTVDTWLGSARQSGGLHGPVLRMTFDGNVRGPTQAEQATATSPADLVDHNVVIGASAAWTRRLYEHFGPLNGNVTHEDRCYGFRAALLGGLQFMPEPLVRYRDNGLSQRPDTSSRDYLFGYLKTLHARYVHDAEQQLQDLERSGQDAAVCTGLRAVIQRRIDEHRFRLLLASGRPPLQLLWQFRGRLRWQALERLPSYAFPRLYCAWRDRRKHRRANR